VALLLVGTAADGGPKVVRRVKTRLDDDAQRELVQVVDSHPNGIPHAQSVRIVDGTTARLVSPTVEFFNASKPVSDGLGSPLRPGVRGAASTPGAIEPNSGYSRSTTSSSPPIIRQNPRFSPQTPPLVPQST